MKVRILGVGMGPQHVTPEVADALRTVDYVLAADKGDDDAGCSPCDARSSPSTPIRCRSSR